MDSNIKIRYVGNGDRKHGLKFDMWESAIVKMGSNLKIWWIRNCDRKNGIKLDKIQDSRISGAEIWRKI